MEDDLRSSLLAICKLLEKYEVSYILIGGTAVALHGYYRISLDNRGELTDKPDIDLWYNPTYENYLKVLKVIKELGHDTSDFENEQNPDPRKSFFKLDFEDFTLDILPEIKAKIKFTEANRKKETIVFEETLIHFMNYYDLIEDKRATARKKDIEDIEHLKKNRREE